MMHLDPKLRKETLFPLKISLEEIRTSGAEGIFEDWSLDVKGAELVKTRENN